MKRDNMNAEGKISNLCYEHVNQWVDDLLNQGDTGLSLVLSAVPDGSVIITPEALRKFREKVDTFYLELSEEEKSSVISEKMCCLCNDI